MTVEEGKKMVETLKSKGYSEEDILAGFYQIFIDEKVDINQLGDLVQLVGYELTDEFRNLSPEDQKTKGWEIEEHEDAEVSEKQNEDAKEYEPGEEKDSEGENSSEDKGEDKKDASSEENKESKPENEEESEEDEEKRAKKLFGLN